LWLKLPVLFDLFTLVLLVGGCLLLWQNLGARRQDVALPTIRGDPEAAEMADRFKANELSEHNGAGLLNSAAPEGADAHADVEDQNHYASSVSSAMAKSKKAAS
jgi:hypothetical protein